MIKEWEDFFKFVKQRDKELDKYLIEISYNANSKTTNRR
mgnify:CR=1 FL=1